MGDAKDMSDWQRRYDESIARESASADPDDTAGAESAAMEASGFLPGWAGAIAFGLTAAVVFIRRIVRRSRRRSE